MCRFPSGDERKKKSGGDDTPKQLRALTTIALMAEMAAKDIDIYAMITKKTVAKVADLMVSRSVIREKAVEALQYIDEFDARINSLPVDSGVHCKIIEQIKDTKVFINEFNAKWLKNESAIDSLVDKINDNINKIIDHKKRAQELIARRDYLKIVDVRLRCKKAFDKYTQSEQTLNRLYNECSDKCEELSNRLELMKNGFKDIVKQSMKC